MSEKLSEILAERVREYKALSLEDLDKWRWLAKDDEDRIAQLEAEVEGLQEIEKAAKEFRDAELKNASHRTTCKNGCDFDASDCDIFGEMWMDEMRKRVIFWDVLKKGVKNV